MTQVRRYQPSDRKELQTLALRLTEGVAPWRSQVRVRAAAIRGWVAEAIARVGCDDAILLVAESGGEVVGFIGVSATEH